MKQVMILHVHPQSKSIHYQYKNQRDSKLTLLKQTFKLNIQNKLLKNTCNTKTSNSTQLKIHNRLHLQQKPFACDQCPKSFTKKSNLTIHIRVHTGDKPYHCEFCKKKFSNSSDLRRHQKIHTGERPYSCDLCPKKFSQSANLILLN